MLRATSHGRDKADADARMAPADAIAAAYQHGDLTWQQAERLWHKHAPQACAPVAPVAPTGPSRKQREARERMVGMLRDALASGVLSKAQFNALASAQGLGVYIP